jgi:hypothetical protein
LRDLNAFSLFYHVSPCFARLNQRILNIIAGATPPVSSVNIVLGALVTLLGAGFTLMIVNLTKKIRALKKRQLIEEA